MTPDLGHGGVLHEGRLDFEGTDQVPGRLDHVVASADEPEVAVLVPAGEVPAQVPAAERSRPGSAPRRRDSRGTSTANRAAAPAPPPGRGRLDGGAVLVDHDLAVLVAHEDGRLDAGQRPAHRPGADVHAGVVGDHDPAGLGLPPVVVDGKPESLLAPHDDLGVERLARRWRRSGGRSGRAPWPASAPACMSMRRAVGAVYQTVTPSASSMPYQRSASKSPSSTMLVTPWTSGDDDAVRGAGDPARDRPCTRRRRRGAGRGRSARWRGAATTASCTCTAPLGVPVVPLVKWSRAMSSGSVAGDRTPVTPPRRARSRWTMPWVDGRNAGGSPPIRITWRRSGQPIDDRLTLRRYKVGVVTRTRPAPSSRR